jgi:transcription termination/antitermination protein NusG
MELITDVRDVSSWFAVWTRPRHERVVRDQLLGKGVETLLPTVMRWSQWKDRRKRIEWPLFPTYCFVRFALAQRLPVLSCVGVINIVSIAGQPAPIPDADVNNIRLLVTTTLPLDPCPMLPDGALVQITAGPLRGLTGRLLTRNSQRACVVLSVDLIGRAVRVEVNAADISPA